MGGSKSEKKNVKLLTTDSHFKGGLKRDKSSMEVQKVARKTNWSKIARAVIWAVGKETKMAKNSQGSMGRGCSRQVE